MKKLHAGLALSTLTLLLAACSPTPTPAPEAGKGPGAQQPAGKLVKLTLRAPASAAAGITGQGLAGNLPDLGIAVTVRDSRGLAVPLVDGVYAPGGQAGKVILNAESGFTRTLLLPAGSYSFETAVKPAGAEIDASTPLLAYGPAGENTADLSGERGVMALKFHAVYDASGSALQESLNTQQLFTGSALNLSLNLRTAPAPSGPGSVRATVPTTDIGPVSYTLGAPTDGTLGGGSKIGTRVTAGGTQSDSVLNVTASFGAWVRNAGEDTASFQNTSLSYARQIQTTGLVADLILPTATLDEPGALMVGQLTQLGGLGQDETQVTGVQVYADNAMIASTDWDEQQNGVSAIRGSPEAGWGADWTPTRAGSVQLSVVVTDAAGNQSRADRTVTVGATAQQPVDLVYAAEGSPTVPFTVGPDSSFLIRVDKSVDMYTFSELIVSQGQMIGQDLTVSIGSSPEDLQPITRYNAQDGSSQFNSYEMGTLYVKVTNRSGAVLNATFYNFDAA